MAQSSNFCFRTFLVAMFVAAWSVTVCSSVSADDGPYCGIYAMYGAAASLGVKGDFQTLVDKKFVSSRAGSSVSDLLGAAEQLGVRARPLTGLGLASLQEAQDPLILHVSSLGQLVGYNHWLLFLGFDDGRARTIDGSGSIHLLRSAELLARWDGVALAVFTGAAPKTNFGAVETTSIGWWAIIVVSVIGAAAWLVAKLGTLGRSNGRVWAAALLAGTLLITAVREAQPAFSFLRNPECVDFIVAAEGLREFPIVSVTEMVELLKRPEEVVVFDTRYRGDMEFGHVPGAIGLPIDSTQQEVALRLEGIDRRRTIVLYCQSAGCGFSDRMAVVLASFGFEDIRLFREGWIGWKEFQNKAQAQK